MCHPFVPEFVCRQGTFALTDYEVFVTNRPYPRVAILWRKLVTYVLDS
jgi:hypothetical protein